MQITTKIRNQDLIAAVISVELKFPEGEEFWLLGIDLVTGETNVSNGLQTGKTTIPLHALKDGETDSLEQTSIFTILSFKENLRLKEDSIHSEANGAYNGQGA